MKKRRVIWLASIGVGLLLSLLALSLILTKPGVTIQAEGYVAPGAPGVDAEVSLWMPCPEEPIPQPTIITYFLK